MASRVSENSRKVLVRIVKRSQVYDIHDIRAEIFGVKGAVSRRQRVNRAPPHLLH